MNAMCTVQSGHETLFCVKLSSLSKALKLGLQPVVFHGQDVTTHGDTPRLVHVISQSIAGTYQLHYSRNGDR